VPFVTSNATGATSPACYTIDALASIAFDSLSSDSALCPLGIVAPFSLSLLMPGGLDSSHSFLSHASELLHGAAEVVSTTEGIDPDDAAALISAAVANANSAYTAVPHALSLRMAAFPSDTNAALQSYGALDDSTSPTSASSTSTDGGRSSSTTKLLLLLFLLLGFFPLLLSHFVPQRVAVLVDQFAMNHDVLPGTFVKKRPTRLGATLTWSFLCTSALAAVLLSTEPNIQHATELLPPSVFPAAGTAKGSWQITLRVFTGESDALLDSWCDESLTKLLSQESGFSSHFDVIAQRRPGHCAIKADCASCSMKINALVAFSLPAGAQMMDWEIWVNAAAPTGWTRRYGVLTQLPGQRLMDAATELQFSSMESYYADLRSRSKNKHTLSGFEIDFASRVQLAPQSASAFTAASSVKLQFRFTKSDVILQTRVTDKQSPLQILTVVASSIVSLFSLFGIAFAVTEKHVLRRLGISSGEVVHGGQVQQQEQRQRQQGETEVEPWKAEEKNNDAPSKQGRGTEGKAFSEVDKAGSMRGGGSDGGNIQPQLPNSTGAGDDQVLRIHADETAADLAYAIGSPSGQATVTDM
jgi:hypothetical protein